MIDFKSTLKMAVVSLKINKMRSMLTSLGIIIGVSAVIIMLAVGTGAREKVQKDMESMGSNLLTIRSASAKTGGVRMGMGTRPTLTIKDAEAIKKNARGIYDTGDDDRSFDRGTAVFADASQHSAKRGDALGSETAVNPGCAGWHSASHSDWINNTFIGFLRGGGGFFSFSNYLHAGSHNSARAVVVCGAGL